MTILDRLDNYGCYTLSTGQRMILIKNGDNPICNVEFLKLNINQSNELISKFTNASYIYSIELLKGNNSYKFYGVEVEIVDTLNDNLFWTQFTTIDGEEFIGYLNIKYLGILLERIIRYD